MEKDFKRYMRARIKNALTEDQEYTQLQTGFVVASRRKDYEQQEKILNKLNSATKELCYLKGYNDAMKLMINSK